MTKRYYKSKFIQPLFLKVYSIILLPKSTSVPIVKFYDGDTNQPVWRQKLSTPVFQDDFQRIEGPAAKEVSYKAEQVLVTWRRKIRVTTYWMRKN